MGQKFKGVTPLSMIYAKIVIGPIYIELSITYVNDTRPDIIPPKSTLSSTRSGSGKVSGKGGIIGYSTASLGSINFDRRYCTE